jgi:putative transposase
MPDYRRAFTPGGTFFFTLVTERRQPILCDPAARRILRNAIATAARSRPFKLPALVILPDHLHAVWQLPAGDADFSSRWSHIKSLFTREWLVAGGRETAVSDSRRRNRRRGVWQRRFWEHALRDENDFNRHVDYIHYNPVKHGLAACPHAWPWSTFHRWAKNDYYDPEWCCTCAAGPSSPIDSTWANKLDME